MSERALEDLIGRDPENLTMDLPCTTILATGQWRVTVVGLLLSDDSAVVHHGFWTGGA